MLPSRNNPGKKRERLGVKWDQNVVGDHRSMFDGVEGVSGNDSYPRRLFAGFKHKVEELSG